ncbi:NAD(P)/FAD-dependent oxidoreductase [Pseudoalteromonas xiamenensis]
MIKTNKIDEQKPKTVAIVGAGIIGLCIGLQLIKRGFQVTLYDPNGVANKCSFGNAGHFATEQVFPLANRSLLPKLPKMLLDPNGPLRIELRYLFKAMPWFTRFVLNMTQRKQQQLTSALRSLNEPSLAAYERLLDNSYDVFISSKGSLLTFENADFNEVESVKNHYASQGVNVQLLTQQDVLALEPNLSHNIKYALLFKEVAHSADPHALCLHLFDEIKSRGGRFIQQRVEHISSTTEGEVIKLANNNNAIFDKVIIASGVWSKSLAKQLGFSVPIDAERGYHSMLNMENPITRPVASADRQFIITPMDNGLRLAGTVEFAGVDAKENHARATMLLTHANALIPATQSQQIESTWMGCRPSLPDSLPVIGVSPSNKNIVFAFGHQHLGLTQGAVTSELVADLLQDIQPSITLTPYRIDRF